MTWSGLPLKTSISRWRPCSPRMNLRRQTPIPLLQIPLRQTQTGPLRPLLFTWCRCHRRARRKSTPIPGPSALQRAAGRSGLSRRKTGPGPGGGKSVQPLCRPEKISARSRRSATGFNNNIEQLMGFTGFSAGFPGASGGNELDAQPHFPALRLGHCGHHGAHQAHFLAVDAGQHPVDEAHAGAAAATQGHAGKIQGRPAEIQPEADRNSSARTRSTP